MRNRRDRTGSRYRRGMGAETSQTANEAMANLYANTCLNIPKETKLYDLKGKKIPLIDILLYKVGDDNPFADPGCYHYERSYWVHKAIGPNNLTYVCPLKTIKKPCPICEKLQVLKDDPEADEKLITALKPKWRQLFNVIEPKASDKGVQIWDFSYYMFGELLIEYLNDEEFQEDLKYWNEFEGGKTLRLGLKEKTFGGRPYYEVTRIDFRERKKDYNPNKMLKQVHCLDNIIKILPYNELKKVFLQVDEGTDSNSGKNKYRRKDVQKIKEMSNKQLKRFVIVNDMDVELDDFEDDPDGLTDAVITEIEASLADKGKGKKRGSGKAKGKEKTTEEIEVGSTVKWEDEDGDSMEGTVLEIKGKKVKKVIIEDDDDEEYTVPLKDLTLKDENGDEDDNEEIEEGSDVTWTDDDEEEHEGEVISIKGKKVVVKEGRKKVTLKLSELEMA